MAEVAMAFIDFEVVISHSLLGLRVWNIRYCDKGESYHWVAIPCYTP